MKQGRFFLVEIGLFCPMILSPFLWGSVYPWAACFSAFCFFMLLFSRPRAFLSVFDGLPRFFLLAAALVFIALPFQSLLFSWNRYAAFFELLKWFAGAAAFSLAFYAAQEQRASSRVLWAFVWLGALESAYGLYETLSGREYVLFFHKPEYRGFLTGTYWNHNHAAGLLELCLGVQWGLLGETLKLRRWGRGILLLILTLLTAFALLKTGSRFGLISFSLAFLAWFAFFGTRLLRRPLFWSVCFLFIFGLILPGGWHTAAERFSDARNWEESLSGRLWVWHDALKIIKDHGLSGIGLGNFKWVFPFYASEKIMLGWDHLHQDYYELLIELGLPLAFFWLAGWTGLWAGLGVKIFKAPADSLFIPGGLWLALTSLALHGLADFNFAIPANAFLFLILFGMASGMAFTRNESPKEHLQRRLPGVRFFLAPVLIISVWQGFAGAFLFSAQRAADAGLWGKTLQRARISRRLDPFNPQALFLESQSLFETGREQRSKQILEKACGGFEKLSRELPFWSKAWLYSGMAKTEKNLLPSGRPDDWADIEKDLRKAIRAEPGNGWIVIKAYETLLRNPDLSAASLQAALGEMKKALSWHYDFQSSYYLEETLQSVWKQFHDPRLLIGMTPPDYESFRRLAVFLENHECWAERAEIQGALMELNGKLYYQRCQKAKILAKNHRFREAVEQYEAAYWSRHEFLEAKAGLLEAAPHAGRVLPEEKAWLQEILESADFQADFLSEVEKSVEKNADPLLTALFAYRKKDFETALKYFETAGVFEKEHPDRRFAVDAYWQSGRRKEALRFLRLALASADPDLAALGLYRLWRSPEASEIDEKISAFATRKFSSKDWSWQGRRELGHLEGPGARLIQVRLAPGISEIRILVRKNADSPVFVRFKLWKDARIFREIGVAGIAVKGWRLFRFSVRTPGGKYALAAELDDALPRAQRGGIDLGPGSIHSL